MLTCIVGSLNACADTLESIVRILLVANFQPDQQESMQRFCELLRAGLSGKGNVVRVVRPQSVFTRLFPRPGGLKKWLGYIDKFLLFPFVLTKEAKDCDVVHICDHSNSIYTRFLGRPNVVTCHDLMAVRSAREEIPENPTGWAGRILQRAILRGLRRAQFVVCVSEHTRQDVLRLAGRSEPATPRIHNGLNYAYSPMDKEQALPRVKAVFDGNIPPYFLHVGGNQWYKNRLGVLRIYAGLRSRGQFSSHRLVMVGKPFSAEMRSFLASNGLVGDVVEVLASPNEDLRALYSLAECLLFPSLEEGFGWPIVEAQACGCPVFTSNRPPMPEVGGDAAVYFDPSNPESACETIAASLDRRKELSLRGQENASRFTTTAMMAAYLKVYAAAVREPLIQSRWW